MSSIDAGPTLRRTPWTTATAPGASATVPARTPVAAAVPADPADVARRALDAQAAAAAAAGSRIVFDTAEAGRTPDMTRLAPQELAAVVNDRTGRFSRDESLWAAAELAGRVAVALSPLEAAGTGAYQRGVKQLYVGMSPEVRRALGWTPGMVVQTDALIADSERRDRRVSDEVFWRLFGQGQDLPGALRVRGLDLTL